METKVELKSQGDAKGLEGHDRHEGMGLIGAKTVGVRSIVDGGARQIQRGGVLKCCS